MYAGAAPSVWKLAHSLYGRWSGGSNARVSTHDQQTLPMQLAAMRDYAKKRKWTVAVEIKDVGSGATTRHKRENLIGAARRREIDLVLVWRLDRWGRSLVDLVNTLQELNALDVGFVSLSEALELTQPRADVRLPACWRSLPSSNGIYCGTG